MNRRDAIKNIGLSLGYAAAVPTALSILQSCSTQTASWTPQFLTTDQGHLITNLIDLILPKTADAPGGVEVNVPEFIDLLALKTFKVEKQKKFKQQLQTVIAELTQNEKITIAVKDIAAEKYDALLAKHLKSTQSERKQFSKEEKTVFNTLKDLRSKAVWAYKMSEYVGENILAYNPIPGEYKSCIDLNEVTDGKAWSLKS